MHFKVIDVAKKELNVVKVSQDGSWAQEGVSRCKGTSRHESDVSVFSLTVSAKSSK